MHVGIFLFEDLTMLDAYAPLQMLAMVEQFNTFTVAKTRAPLKSDCGAMLTPDHDFETCPALDILVVPGGGDVLAQMQDRELLDWLREVASGAKYVTSVCTGALILAEAGLLDAYRATTHWGWVDQLKDYSAIEVIDKRVVVDRDRISGGGITAGLDFALTVIVEVVGVATAQSMQLIFEYRPEPPFDSGSPHTAPAGVLAQVSELIGSRKGALAEFTRRRRRA